MCKPSDNLKLCTCNDMEGQFKGLQWHLSQGGETSVMGETLLPYERSNTPFNEYVIQQLNTDNRFDFTYVPKKGDRLEFVSTDKGALTHDQVDLIYNGSAWEKG